MRATQADWEKYHDELSFGDPHAREFSAMWSAFCHMIDDVIDGEKIKAEGFVEELIRVIGEFSFNPFYQKHRCELFPLIIQSASAFMDSYRWEDSPDHLKHNHANALRSFYDCVNYQVAYISSGYDFGKMRTLTKKWRDFIWVDVNADGADALDQPWRER